MLVIGISGKKGSGKSLIRDHLERQYGFKSLPMAEPLKSMLRALGVDEDGLTGDKKHETCDLLMGVTYRHAMQTLGTEWGRMMIHEDLWIELWKRKAAGFKQPLVADDIRFPNEFEAIRKCGGRILRVVRTNQSSNDKHLSETAVDDEVVDYTITNFGESLVDLRKTVDRAMQIIRLGK